MDKFSYNSNTSVLGKESKSRKKEIESIFRSMYAQLCNYAMNFVLDRDKAKDLVQAVFLRLWEHREISSSGYNLDAYLYQSVRNECLNYLKSEKVRSDARKEVRIRIKEWKESPRKSKENYDKLRKLVREGIQKLPDKCREIYCLSRDDGLTYKEIARIQGISVNTVETHIRRALKSLRLYVLEYLD